MPDGIGPDPGAHAHLFAAIEQVINIMPPKVMLTDAAEVLMLLMAGSFLVHAKMEQAGLTEQFGNLRDHILANLIVFAGGYHARILSQPGIMAAGEIQLGQGLHAQVPDLLQFVAVVGGDHISIHVPPLSGTDGPPRPSGPRSAA